MFFKNKSTYRQLVFMFGLLLVINFITIIATLRQLTIEPTAKQMAMFINNQLNSIQKLIMDKNISESRLILSDTFTSGDVIISNTPNARIFPDLKFYNVLSYELSKKQLLQLKLEESDDNSRIWLKPQWLEDYWLGIKFQPFVKKVSRLLLTVIATLLILSLIAAFLFSKYMLKPFKQLAQMAVNIVQQISTVNQIEISGTQEVQEIAQLVKSSAEQIQQLSKEKELLLAGVSHDLRTPLARMRLQAEFLNDDVSRDNIIQEVEEMDQIIGDFVAYVRSGTIEQFQPTNLIEIINESIEQFSLLGKSIEFNMPNSSLIVSLKPLSFKRMLTNIFENAFKYGEPPVEINIYKNKKITKISIIDHGNGIDEQELSTIFEPFIMAHNTDNQFGSGLGLSIVKKLAHQNKAKVYAENHLKGGLCVWIEFKNS